MFDGSVIKRMQKSTPIIIKAKAGTPSVGNSSHHQDVEIMPKILSTTKATVKSSHVVRNTSKKIGFLRFFIVILFSWYLCLFIDVVR